MVVEEGRPAHGLSLSRLNAVLKIKRPQSSMPPP